MENVFTPEDRKRIKERIAGKYGKVAISPEGSFKYPTGRAGLEGQGYDPGILKALPEEVLASYCGVGNPFSLGPIHNGAAVLDIGCGAGVDTIVAAIMAGPEGRVVGMDLTPEMLERAKENSRNASLENVTFQEGSAEDLAFAEASFDVVISNGVFNLVPDKARALKEVFRVLKPNGRFMLADQVLATAQPADARSMVESWAEWQGGALPGKDFLALMREAGFTEAELVAETGFNSSPVTKGVLFRATRPAISDVGRLGMPVRDSLGKYQEFFNAAYAEGAIDRKTKHLIALGASLAAGCDPWTRYCLAVARELGATDDELQETMAIAMTVGATKIRILQKSALASMAEKKGAVLQPQQEDAAPAAQESCFTWTT